MRTLREIENDVLDKSKARAEELMESLPVNIMTKNEIVAFQAQARYSDIYCQMHGVLVEMEKFLNTNFNHEFGCEDRENARKSLLEKLAKV